MGALVGSAPYLEAHDGDGPAAAEAEHAQQRAAQAVVGELTPGRAGGEEGDKGEKGERGDGRQKRLKASAVSEK